MNTKSKKTFSILTQYFYPEINSTAQLLFELAEDLGEKGMSIFVYAKYPSNIISKNRIIKHFKNIKINWTKTTNFNKSNIIGRSINYIVYLFRLAFKLLFDNDNSPLLVISSPPFLPLIAFALNKIKRRKYIYLVHDLYPDIAVKLGFLKKDGIIEKIWAKFNRSLIKNSEFTIVLDKNMKKMACNYVDKIDLHKIHIINNWADGEYIKPLSAKNNHFIEKCNLRDKFIIEYAGNFGLTHNLEQVLEVAEEFKGTNALFLLVGEGAKEDKLYKIKNQGKLDNVLIFPFQKREDLPFVLSAADISLIILDKGFNGLSMPSKLYSIMASGRPILACVEYGSEVENILRKADCGIVVPPNDPSKVKQVILEFMNNPERTI